MIKSKDDLRRYLAEDLLAVRPNPIRTWRVFHRWQYPTVHFQRRLRHLEYLVNCRTGRLWKPYVLWRRLRVRALGIRLGFSIPPNVFGPGLSLPHWGTIVVNDKARIGARCRVHTSTNIGEKDGKAPLIGDDCYIGPGAKLFGDIRLGNGVSIGANAVVNRSFPDGAVLVGIPARPITSGDEVQG